LIFFMISIAVADALLPQMTRIAIDDFIVPNTTEGLNIFIFKLNILFIQIKKQINVKLSSQKLQ